MPQDWVWRLQLTAVVLVPLALLFGVVALIGFIAALFRSDDARRTALRTVSMVVVLPIVVFMGTLADDALYRLRGRLDPVPWESTFAIIAMTGCALAGIVAGVFIVRRRELARTRGAAVARDLVWALAGVLGLTLTAPLAPSRLGLGSVGPLFRVMAVPIIAALLIRIGITLADREAQPAGEPIWSNRSMASFLVVSLAAVIVIALPGGYGHGRVDVVGAIDPASDRFAVVVDYSGCSGGHIPGPDDIRRLTVSEGPDHIGIEVLVDWPRTFGGYACPWLSGPRVQCTITLDRPIGDRPLFSTMHDERRRIDEESPVERLVLPAECPVLHS